jgi:predicted extracellular nuclease
MKKIILVGFTVMFVSLAFAQDTITTSGNEKLKGFEKKNEQALRVAFYNVENLFDTFNDTLKNDEDFLPTGVKGWTFSRYLEKLDHIYKTLTALGGWDLPAIVGFCEIENRYVLNELITKTPLVKAGYSIVHEDSPDNRGIDVGLIYRPEKFRPIKHEAIRIVFPFDPSVKTRDVLYVKGIIFKKDTLHVFINHWPSKLGGAAASEPRRTFVAQKIKHYVDSIYRMDPEANIIITGDFNDEPGDKSLMVGLGAINHLDSLKGKDLYNTSYPFFAKGIGTEKYKEHWAVLDQMIVSSPMVTRKKGVMIQDNQSSIFDAPWLLEDDEKFMGKMPFRTYGGPKYLGGYSDHLPVFIDVIKKK